MRQGKHDEGTRVGKKPPELLAQRDPRGPEEHPLIFSTNAGYKSDMLPSSRMSEMDHKQLEKGMYKQTLCS
jgi:hypothetical protein